MIRGMKTKRCGHCKVELPLSNFKKTTSKIYKDGYWPTCITCKRAQNAAWKKANPEKVAVATARQRAANPQRFRDSVARHRARLSPQERSVRWRKWDLQKHYGMTVAEYDAILLAQGGVCAICSGTSNDGRRLHVDHNHATEENRGLLCNRCNLALERLDEIPDWHTKAINYLAKYLTVRMDMKA